MWERGAGRRALPFRCRSQNQEEGESLENNPELLESLSKVMLPKAAQKEGGGVLNLVDSGAIKEAYGEQSLGIASILVELPVPVDSRTTKLLKQEIESTVRGIEWVRNPLVVVTVPEGELATPEVATPLQTDESSDTPRGKSGNLENVRHVVSVASCKGGVGKSTTSVNLAFALRSMGFKVGIIDADLYGPSLPTMVRPNDARVSFGDGASEIEPVFAHGIKMMSMGFINPTDSMVVRGARAAPLVQQLLTRTRWGDLDYLVIDMPPGTGDIQLMLSQTVPIDAAVIVTTPQRLSFVDVVKGVEMFDKVGIPCVSVVENMAYWQNKELAQQVRELMQDHGLSSELTSEIEGKIAAPQKIFGEGHRKRLSEMWGIDNTYSIPLEPTLAKAGDSGKPYFISDSDSPIAEIYNKMAADLVTEVDRMDSAMTRPVVTYDATMNAIVSTLADGTEQRISPVEVRRRCRSPTNIQELITEDVKPVEIFPMGNYAIQILWNDGHQSLMPYRSFIEFNNKTEVVVKEAR